MVYPFDKFLYIGNFIIDNLEGGYYHPDFYINGAPTIRGGRISAAAFVKADYGRSGETLYGLDRHAGWDSWYSSKRLASNPQENLKYIYGGNYKYANDDAKNFWTTLDRLDARHKWPHEYMGGTNRQVLQDLCIKIMYQYFLKYVWSKLNDGAKEAVIKDNKLACNYIYSAWNGIGFSNKYGKIINDSINNNISDTNVINKRILYARQSSKSALIRQGGNKIEKLQPKIKNDIPAAITNAAKKKTGKNVFLGRLVPIIIILIIFRKKIFK